MPSLSDDISRFVTQMPDIVQQQDGHSQIEARFVFQDDFVGFDGHFPGNPILPGIVQIMLAQYTAAQGSGAVIAKVKKCKFASQIKPQDQVLVRVDETSSDRGNKYKASVYANDLLCATISFELSVSK